MNPTVVWLPRANTELLYLRIANLTKASNRHSLILALNSLAEADDGRYYHSGDVNDVVGQVDAL